MFSTILSNLRSNPRISIIANNLGSKLTKRLFCGNFTENHVRNCIKTEEYIKLNPIIVNEINESNRKTDPILDKLDSNKVYILVKSLNISPKQINPILLPNLTAFRDIGINGKEITDSGNEEKTIKEMPSAYKPVKMRLDYKIIRDPRSYTHLTIIRRHKMNKHKRLKWRKKMLSFLKKKFLKRNIKKEKDFRAELLSQIKEAEEFDAEKYVRTILETIDNVPKVETPIEKIEKIRELIRKNRRETNLISPKFDP